MLPSDLPAWLFHDVPLWAFAVALLTRPATWTEIVLSTVRGRFEAGESA